MSGMARSCARGGIMVCQGLQDENVTFFYALENKCFCRYFCLYFLSYSFKQINSYDHVSEVFNQRVICLQVWEL